ncbi:MAG: hypothetical protein K6U74_15075, partial [Firmicutes bacterium]|nr:hypothetical protein [Bacillota bacterium]
MAYNILAESNQKVNWASLHADVYSDNILIEFLPLPGQGLSGGDAIGLSVPSKNCGKEAWQQLVRIMRVLKDRYKMDLYDLYSG